MKSIDIQLRKSQILNDVVAKMNVLGRTLEIEDNFKELAGYISSPDDNDTKPIVARAITEGFDRVKSICQRYLVYGRTTDDNRLEQLMSTTTVVTGIIESIGETSSVYMNAAYAKGTEYKFVISAANDSKDISLTDSNNETIGTVGSLAAGGTATINYNPSRNANQVELEGQGKFTVKCMSTEDVTMTLALSMPSSFNEGVTSHIKSCAHHIIVANVLQEFLRDQTSEKAGSYKTDIPEQEEMLRKALNARRPFSRSSHDWS